MTAIMRPGGWPGHSHRSHRPEDGCTGWMAAKMACAGRAEWLDPAIAAMRVKDGWETGSAAIQGADFEVSRECARPLSVSNSWHPSCGWVDRAMNLCEGMCTRVSPEPTLTRQTPESAGVFFFCFAVRHAEILQKPGRPLPCPYLPTYLPTLLMGN